MREKIKHILRDIVYKYCSTDPYKIISIVNDYDVVSFDVFDTLIKRNVKKPEDVFSIMETIAGKRYNRFAKIRRACENKVRTEKNREITLKEIYTSMNFYTDEEKEYLINLEIQVEKEISAPNLSIKKVFDWCIVNKKQILLISDMYLPEEVIRDILESCGYHFIPKIYVSCEHNSSKANGGLFELVKSTIYNKKWCHIGDSINGDYRVAESYCDKAILIRRELNNPDYVSEVNSLNQDIFYGFMKAFIQNHENNNYGDFEKIGYEILGPLLVGFCIWLNKQISTKNYDRVLFLSRDAKLILMAYTKLFGEEDRNCYFYVSRKAAITTIIDKITNYDELHDLFVPKDSARIIDLFKALNVDSNAISKKYLIDQDTMINNNKEIKKETLLEICLNHYQLDTQNQRKLLLEYLKDEKCINNIALVDLGWEGRTQWALKRLMPNCRIDGYYIGIITKYARLSNSLNMSAYLGNMKNVDRKARVIMESIALFESLFLSKEGSTLGYEKFKDKVRPIFASRDQVEETQINIDNLQSAALQFVDDISKTKIYKYFSWTSDYFFNSYTSLAIKPTNKIIKLFRNVQFRDDELYSFGADHSLFYYLLHPKEFTNVLWKSRYRVFTLKDICKLPLPYFEVLYFFYKNKHKMEN